MKDKNLNHPWIFFWLTIILVIFPNCKEAPKKSGAGVEGNPVVSNTPSYPTPIKLTQGPKQHWFGYYDKLQMDPTGRYVLGMEVDTFYRSPTPHDVLTVGMVDLKQDNRWIPLGESRAWGWQQGCMLQWIPGSTNEIIWNDVQDGKFVSHILNVETLERRTLPKAIYSLSNDGTFALGTEFSRIQNLRPGYGYPGVDDPYAQDKAPEEIGLYKMHLGTGEIQMLFSIADLAGIPNMGEALDGYWNYFNHILIGPDDKRFVFLHRWRKELGNRADRAVGGFTTRMVSAHTDGSDLYLLDPSGHTSHFIWKDENNLCMWTKPAGKKEGFYLFTDKTDSIVPVGQDIMSENGHNTYMTGTNGEWILNDTYPSGKDRLQTLYLYHVPTQKKIDLGKFHQPDKFEKEWRCDLHPKSGPNGKWVIFDSTHEGDGRQIYIIDISHLIR